MSQLSHHGAVTGVTGSCHRLTLASGESLLVDCGLFQGDEAREAGAHSLKVDFPVDDVRALLVTHCHIDHVGRIPGLIAAGFRGPIYATSATAHLLPLVLEDALRLGLSHDRQLIAAFARQLGEQLQPRRYDAWFPVQGMPGTRARFQVAGHILGSAYIEIDTEDGCTVFSGDLGARSAPLLPEPRSPERADRLVIESTYGDRHHEGREERHRQLQRVLARSLSDGGAVLIPAFSMGRTQELLYEIETIIAEGGPDWEALEVVVDSPLAAKFTLHYREFQELWDAEARARLAEGRHPLDFRQLLTVEQHSDHVHLVNHLRQSGRPAVVIAASGMCTGGRITNYLKALLPDPRTDVLFVGYQARGTPGRAIQLHGPRNGWVELDGMRVQINAGVHTLSGYSAHADQQDLLAFVDGIRIKPREVRVVHGDDEAKRTLAGHLRERIVGEILIPAA